jgi:hypothetical protein
MLLIAHITIALASLVFVAATFLKPKEQWFSISLGLIAATLTSGTLLVASANSNLAPACLSGLVYLGIVSSVLFIANYKLLKIKIKYLFVNSLLANFSL